MSSQRCSTALFVVALSGTMAVSNAGHAQSDRKEGAFGSFSPGFRIGYTFGVGLTLGVELSMHVRTLRYELVVPSFGVSGGFDVTYRDRETYFFRVYGHVEAGAFVFGLGAGPAYIWGPENLLTYEFAAFAGVPFVTSGCRDPPVGTSMALYYRTTPRAYQGTTHETGAFVKRFFTTLQEKRYCD